MNLIPYNPTGGFEGSSREAIDGVQSGARPAADPVDRAAHARPRDRGGLRAARDRRSRSGPRENALVSPPADTPEGARTCVGDLFRSSLSCSWHRRPRSRRLRQQEERRLGRHDDHDRADLDDRDNDNGHHGDGTTATDTTATDTTATSGTDTSAAAALGALASSGNCKSFADLGAAFSSALSGANGDLQKEAAALPAVRRPGTVRHQGRTSRRSRTTSRRSPTR